MAEGRVSEALPARRRRFFQARPTLPKLSLSKERPGCRMTPDEPTRQEYFFGTVGD